MPNPITEKKPEPDPRDASPRSHERGKSKLESGKFPSNALFALFDDRDAAQQVAKRLKETGVDGDVKIWSRKSDADELDPDKEEPSGLFDRLLQMAQELSDFRTFLGECADFVRSGRTLFLAPCEDKSARTDLERLVKEGGGAPLAYTKDWTLVKYVQTTDADRQAG